MRNLPKDFIGKGEREQRAAGPGEDTVGVNSITVMTHDQFLSVTMVLFHELWSFVL